VAAVSRHQGPLFDSSDEEMAPSPLPEMSSFEETVADYMSTEMASGPHLMAYYRRQFQEKSIFSAAELAGLPNGMRVRTGGAVVVRQRPGTAKGFVFLSLEDETGMAQAIVKPDIFRENRALIVGSPGLIVEGRLQKTDGTLSVRAEKFWRLPDLPQIPSHDFR
jgi:error-prone DNA polymerase